MVLKLLGWENISPKEFDMNLTQLWHDVEMPSWCLILKQLDSREAWICTIVSEEVLSVDNPSRCLSIEHQKIVLKVVFKVDNSGGGV